MKKIFLFAAVVVIISLFKYDVFAQVKISGVVVDNKDGSTLTDAMVRVLKLKDSSVVKGAMTDAGGGFVILDVSKGKYFLEVRYLGYSTFRKRVELKEDLLIDTVRLRTDGYATEEIKVEDETPDMKFDDEKKIFDVDKIASAKGGSVLDILRKIPMVDVDQSDVVSLRGSANVLILIDNKPMKFSSLRQVPADAVKNVEIITNPSAKYEAEGVTGIINIVMREKVKDVVGYNGYLYTGLRNDLKSGYGNAGLNLNKNKWSYFINGGGGIFHFENTSVSQTVYDLPASTFKSNSDGHGQNKYGYISLGAEYEILKDHSIGTDVYFNKSLYDNSNLGLSKTYNDAGMLSSNYTNGNDINGNFLNLGASLYYTGKFDKIGKELNVDTYFGKEDSQNDGYQFQQYYDSLGLPIINPNKQRSSTNNNNWNVKLQADYTNPFNELTKFETGYKGTFRMNDNDYAYDTLDYSVKGYVRSPEASNRFKLNESINALYGTFSHKIKNFKFKVGLRMEHTHTVGDLFTTGFEFTKDYFDLFPSLSLSQKIGLVNEFQLSYSRRITRPNIWRLNPFVNRYNSRFLSFGNPELQPEFTNSFELSYNYFSNIISATTSLFYRRSNDVITTYSYLVDSITTATTYRNGAGSTAYGSDLILRSSAYKWMNLNATFSFYQTKFDSDALTDYKSEEGFAWRANIRSTFTIGELFILEAYYNYNGKRFNATGFNEPVQNFDISISKKFLKNKMTISFQAEDIFNTRKWASERNGIGFKTNSSSTYDSRVLYLNVSYNFGNTDKYYQQSKKNKKNENENQDTKESN
jgi:outer membrane receptor protein involved in Fe transport